jgi:hypothetical protein
MDLQKTDEYLRAHWPAVLLMALIVIPGTATAVSFFRPGFDIENRLRAIEGRIQALDRLYRVARDDENRLLDEDIERLFNKSSETAAVSSAPGTPKDNP